MHSCSYCGNDIKPTHWYSLSEPRSYYCNTICMRNAIKAMQFIKNYVNAGC